MPAEQSAGPRLFKHCTTLNPPVMQGYFAGLRSSQDANLMLQEVLRCELRDRCAKGGVVETGLREMVIDSYLELVSFMFHDGCRRP